VLLCESVLPERNEPGVVNFLDLEMLAISGGQERTEQEYRALFESAGLQLSGITPMRFGMSILEASVAR